MTLGFWKHSNELNYKNSACETFINTKTKDTKLLNELKLKGICYHFTAFTFEILVKIKLSERFYNKGNYIDIIEKYYTVNDYFDSIIDNELIKYIDERDISLCAKFMLKYK